MSHPVITWAEFLERFWRRVDKSGNCWLWTGKSRSGSLGYGAIRLPKCFDSKRRMRLVHRVSFFLAHGRWPINARHTCDTPLCVKPEHLIEGTQRDNVHDAINRGRARNGNIKLNPSIWKAIRESSEPNSVLAVRYKVHPAHIRKIKSGTTGRFYRP